MATIPVDITIPDINTEQLTEKALNGEGVFDQLMAAVNAQILEQYAAERITADNYAQVYLGAMQTVLGQSVQFLLTKDKAAYEAALVLAQVKKAEKEIDLVDAQILLTEAQTDKVRQDIAFSQDEQTLIPFQRDKLSEEVNLTRAQADVAEKQVILMDSEIDKAKKEVEVMTQQIEQSKEDIKKTKAEVDLLEQQVLNAQEQILKSKAETALLEQKKVTEEAQTIDGATGVLGAQVNLYKAQTQGFKDDAIRKGVKAANDVYAIAKSNDPDAVSDPTNMNSVLEYFLTTMQTAQESAT